MSQISEPVKWHGGSEGDGVIPLMGSAAWWWLSTFLFSIWRFEAVDLNFLFLFLFFIYLFLFFIFFPMVVLKSGMNGGHRLGGSSGFLFFFFLISNKNFINQTGK